MPVLLHFSTISVIKYSFPLGPNVVTIPSPSTSLVCAIKCHDLFLKTWKAISESQKSKSNVHYQVFSLAVITITGILHVLALS